MEKIKHIHEISSLLKRGLFQGGLEEFEGKENKVLQIFLAGQRHLCEQVLYSLEQIKISMELNDGHFVQLIGELEENLGHILKESGEGVFTSTPIPLLKESR